MLMWALFFYDIFWVFKTDVMVTVAKSLDAPIKLLFPYALNEEEIKFSMLGLGDIVIPGIFISLCVRYDINSVLDKEDKQLKKEDIEKIPTPYFYVVMISYAVGIVITFTVMVLFEHP